MKILIALDVAHTSNKDEALAAAELFDINEASATIPLKDAEVILLYVKEALPSYEAVLKAQADFPEDLGHVIERRAKSILEIIKLSLENHGAKVKSEIVSGVAPHTIETVARDEKVELVILSQKKHKEPFFLSRVSHHVARHAPVSTLILHGRGHKNNDLPETIVVGLDGTRACLDAAKKALLAMNLKKGNTKIILVHVVNVSKLIASVTPFAFVTAMQENLMMEGGVFLSTAQKELSDLGFTSIDSKLLAGSPDHEIMKVTEEAGGDLIVIGAQGGTAIKHFLMGHICERVISRAEVSTLVAR